MKIDTSTWKKFCFTEIFKVCKGFYNKKPEPSGNGTIPFLSATSENNGVTEHYTLEEISSTTRTGNDRNDPLSRKLFPGHAVCVTNNGSVGYAYYQAESFTCSHDVNPLYRLEGEFNKATGLFVASVIMKDRYRWAYGRKWRPERMQHSTINLPATVDGKPDWQWMESYIDSLHSKPLTTQNDVHTASLDTTDWQEFEVQELFNVIYGVNLELVNCIETDKNDPEAVAFVSRTASNNGVSAFVKPVPGVEPQPADTITVAGGGSVLATFLQTQPFYSGRDLYLLYPKESIPHKAKLFIATLIKANKYRYNYGRQANVTLPHLRLRLPVISDGKPDWQWMESYIKSLPYGDRL